MIHLAALRLSREDIDTGYPFDVPVIAQLHSLAFHTPVTFFVGENGAGKSTLLEAIGAGARSITVGGEDIAADASLAPARALAGRLRLTWKRKSHRGFFMRAEDFLNYSRRVARLAGELDDLSSEYDQSLAGYGRTLATGMVRGQRAALIERYGEDLDARSHGESFLKLFQARFVPGGLYLLDEPDTALSPQRQLSLLHLIKTMVDQDAQFIIATQSPFLMAFPGATILSFDRPPIRAVRYDEVEQVVLARNFLERPDAYLRQL
ncbi:MAG TPA: AAA family ATPase [Chloroflexota bacterium]|nr:AAA family ATPase [Chloroflexota bacterium]